jgi:hypothetical protein
MSAADHGPAGSSLTREQVLDELDFLAGLAPADYLRATRRSRPPNTIASVMVKSWLRRVSNSRTAPSV